MIRRKQNVRWLKTRYMRRDRDTFAIFHRRTLGESINHMGFPYCFPFSTVVGSKQDRR